MSDDLNDPMPAEPEPGAEASGAAPEPAAAEPQPATADAATTSSASEAWGDVLASMASLGEALSAWAKAAANEPGNRQHIEEIKAGVNEMAKQADAALSSVANSDMGKQISENAQQAGDAIGAAAAEFSQAAAPHVATAFAGLADVFGRAAQKVSEAAVRPGESTGRAAPEPPSSAANEEDVIDVEPAEPAGSKPASTGPEEASDAS